MNAYNCLVTYARPSHCGGIESNEKKVVIYATDETTAEEKAPGKVNDPNYLYTIMVDVCKIIKS